MSDIQEHSSHRQKGGETRVFLENLPKDVRKDEIDKEFSIYGRIAKVYLIYDPPGSGFVEYYDSGDAEFAASSMNGVEFLGSRLRTQLTRGGMPRGRGSSWSGSSSGRGFSNRGRGFSSNYGDRDGGFSSRGNRGGGGGGSRGFDRGGSRGGYGSSRGSYNKSYPSRGGFSRGGGRGYGRGESSGRGFSSRLGNDNYRSGKYDDGDMDQNGYSQKYDKYSKFERYEKTYDKPESGYSRYPPSEKFANAGSSHRESYQRSRSPLSASPNHYRSSSPVYQHNRSRSPFSRVVRESYSSRSYEQNPKSLPSDSRELLRKPRTKNPRNYRSEHSEESASGDAYGGRKEYISSSYGGRRNSAEGRY